MENYPLTWLKSKQKLKADTEENPTNVLSVEYQDYWIQRRYIQERLKRTYNLFNALI